MAKTPEKRVKDVVVEILKLNNIYYFYAFTGGYGSSGVPDIIACVNGFFLAIECKAGKNKPTDLQTHNIERIIAAGGCAIVVYEDNAGVATTIAVETLKNRSWA